MWRMIAVDRRKAGSSGLCGRRAFRVALQRFRILLQAL